MRKILFVATIDKHIIRFHLPYLEWFKQEGFEVHVAAKGNEQIPFCDVRHLISIERTPFSTNNVKAVNELKLIVDGNNFDLVHCHTAMGSVVTRLACTTARKKGTKVLYTAHGFHFFKNGPLKNWLMYFPLEKLLSPYTDAIITINQEDFSLVQQKKFKTNVHLLSSGMGVDQNRFKPVGENEKQQLRVKHGYQKDAFILICVGEFIHRKNQRFILDAVVELKKEIPTVVILFAGRGILLEAMEKYAISLGIENAVRFLGFRSDVNELMNLSDIGISASRQEGLGLNLAEEMLSGLPVVATVDRGHKEIIEHGYNGYMFDQNNSAAFKQYILELYSDTTVRKKMSEHAMVSAQKFTLDKAKVSLVEIYKQYI